MQTIVKTKIKEFVRQKFPATLVNHAVVIPETYQEYIALVPTEHVIKLIDGNKNEDYLGVNGDIIRASKQVLSDLRLLSRYPDILELHDSDYYGYNEFVSYTVTKNCIRKGRLSIIR